MSVLASGMLVGFRPGPDGGARAGAGVAQGGLGPILVVVADPQDHPFKVPAPPPRLAGANGVLAPTAQINVIYLPNGSTDRSGATCQTWPSNAQSAFEYAVTIWEGQIASPVPIVVEACWSNLGSPSILGYGGALNYYRDFSGAPIPGTWYQVALANALHGSDLDAANPDMMVTFNTGFSWHYDPHTTPAPGTYDLVSVVLHELGHGLGFAGSMRVDNGSGAAECDGVAGHGCWGGGTGYPMVYDRFAEDNPGTSLLNTGVYPQNSAALGTRLTTPSGVYFDGTNTRAAYGGQRVPLYTPATWAQGSSYSHLDEIFNGTANALMTYSLAPQEQVHSPGPIMLGMFKDMGWVVASPRAWVPLVMKEFAPFPWTTLVNETFEGAFPGVWTVFDNDGATNGTYFWAKRTCRAYEGANSGWAVGGGANGAALACGANYPNNADSWMVYGPFSLADATAADLTFRLWLNSESGADVACRMASINGSNFYGSCTSGNSGGWVPRTLDLAAVPTLGDLRGQPNVWVALIFVSNSSTTFAEGAYADNIVLRKCTYPVCNVSASAAAPAPPGLVEFPATFTLQPR